MKNKFFICSIFILLFSGCMFYSVKGSLPAHIGSISLAPVTNQSTEFILAEIVVDDSDNIINGVSLSPKINNCIIFIHIDFF